ncbi:MAG: hypothetical protein ACE5OY_01935 [Candidatus Bathyarchaeia archaeon]
MNNGDGVVGVAGLTLPVEGTRFDRLMYKFSSDILKATLAVNLPMVPGYTAPIEELPSSKLEGSIRRRS